MHKPGNLYINGINVNDINKQQLNNYQRINFILKKIFRYCSSVCSLLNIIKLLLNIFNHIEDHLIPFLYNKLHFPN